MPGDTSSTVPESSHLSSLPPREVDPPVLSQFLSMETKTHKDQEGAFPWTESVLGPREFECRAHSFYYNVEMITEGLFFMTLLSSWEVAILQSSLGLEP